MKLYAALLVAVAGTALPCQAIATDGPFPLFGFADISCGTWAKSQKNEMERAQYLYWFRGFVSGFNYASKTQQVPLEAMPDFDTLTLFVDKYCRENPLKPFVGAAIPLVKELTQKKK